MKNPLARFLPGDQRYTRARFVGDLAGGIIAALIALPYGLAMASLMGLPPVMGLFTSILAAPLLAVFGRNPILIGGTANATVPFIAQAAHDHGPTGAALLALLAALIMIVFAFLRVGRHIMHVPHAVISGFSCGIGALMIIFQLNTLLGIPSDGASFSSPAETFLAVLSHLHDMRIAPLLIGLIVVTAAVICSRLSPFVPGPLIAILLAIGAAHFFGFHEKEVGPLPTSLPAFFAFPWTLPDILKLLPSAVGLAFVASINILITVRVVEHVRGHHQPMQPADADAELRAFGIANTFAALFGAPTSVANPARSVAVVRCGGTTPLANLFHAAILALILILGAGFVARIPLPALAGLTIWIALSLLGWSTWRRLPKMRRTDAAAFLLTTLAVLFVNSVLAVLLGCSIYLVKRSYSRWLSRSAAPFPSTPQSDPLQPSLTTEESASEIEAEEMNAQAVR